MFLSWKLNWKPIKILSILGFRLNLFFFPQKYLFQTLKSKKPFPSVSKVLKTWSQKWTVVIPGGKKSANCLKTCECKLSRHCLLKKFNLKETFWWLSSKKIKNLLPKDPTIRVINCKLWLQLINVIRALSGVAY